MEKTLNLPELNDTIIDPGTVQQLFSDVSQYTQLIEIILKQGPRDYATDQTYTLEQARALFESNGARCVQLRYVYEGSQWWDTLISTPQGTRLVRIEHQPSFGDSSA